MNSNHVELDWCKWIREQRERKGWTQRELAYKLGAGEITISRWERGSIPNGTYQTKLKRLFQGEYGEQSSEDTASESVIFSPRSALFDLVIPRRPVLATELIGRDDILKSVVPQISAHCGSYAFKGMPGVGKTAIVTELAYYYDEKQCFPDGILWAGLGRYPNVPGLLARWGSLLQIDPVERAKLTTIEDWQRSIRDAIGYRRMLLIIDDAWMPEMALAFKIGGLRCVHIVTTRFREIAFEFTRNERNIFLIKELGEKESINLLKALAPKVVQHELPEAEELVRSVGRLPLALTIIGRYLQKQEDSLQPHRIRIALDQLRNVQDRLRLKLLQTPGELPTYVDDNREISLYSTIEVSDQWLNDKGMQRALRVLSIFPAKPNSFSDVAAAAVCHVSVEQLDKLVDTGLLESHGDLRYSMHQTIADYAHSFQDDPLLQEQMVEYYISYIEHYATDYAALESENQNVLAAFELACSRNMLSTLIRGINAYATFLQLKGEYASIEPYLTYIREEAIVSHDEQNFVGASLHLGHIAKVIADLKRAGQYYEEGLNVARRLRDNAMICTLLINRGEVLVFSGAYAQAEPYFHEGLAMAQKLGAGQKIAVSLENLGELVDSRGNHKQADTYYLQASEFAQAENNMELMSIICQNLAVNAQRRGNFKQADEYLQEGLDYARKIHHLQRMSAMLMNIGMQAFLRDRYDEAEKYYKESLELAEQIRHPVRISAVLQNLGILERFRKHDSRAQEYLQKSLEIAREIEYGWLIGEALQELGELHLQQKNIDESERDFDGALEQAQHLEAKELEALAKFGLARVALLQQDRAKARHLGEESLSLLNNMEDRRTKEIEQWLRGNFPP